jgi:very-short-patch-repair endonuclease
MSILTCECGSQASKKVISPITNKPVCRPCNRKHSESPEGKLIIQANIQIKLQKEEFERKAKQRVKSKEKRERRKAGLIKPVGSHEFDTKEFREKQKTLPARQKYLREHATPAELHIKGLLEEGTHTFMFQKGFIAYDYYCIVDFYIKYFDACIEIDGGYHESPEQRAHDARKDKYLTEVRGCTVRRLTNEEALSIKSFQELMDRLDLTPAVNYYSY